MLEFIYYLYQLYFDMSRIFLECSLFSLSSVNYALKFVLEHGLNFIVRN